MILFVSRSKGILLLERARPPLPSIGLAHNLIKSAVGNVKMDGATVTITMGSKVGNVKMDGATVTITMGSTVPNIRVRVSKDGLVIGGEI